MNMYRSLDIDIPLLTFTTVSKTTILPHDACDDRRCNRMCGFVWHGIFHVPDLSTDSDDSSARPCAAGLQPQQLT
jgi:hypothetical protein